MLWVFICIWCSLIFGVIFFAKLSSSWQVNWTWAEVALLSLFPSTWLDPTTRKNIKTAFYSKTYFVKLVLLVKLTLYGPWKTTSISWKMEDTFIFWKMADELNILENGIWPQSFGKWKMTKIFWKMEVCSTGCTHFAPTNYIFAKLSPSFKSSLGWRLG
jgi:hypothetical protein